MPLLEELHWQYL
nr:unnamed protein product [Callosobruchus chinensis]